MSDLRAFLRAIDAEMTDEERARVDGEVIDPHLLADGEGLGDPPLEEHPRIRGRRLVEWVRRRNA